MEQVFQIKEQLGRITSPEKLFNKIKKINIDYEQENFLVIFLNTKNKFLGAEVLFKGGLNACLVCPKTIFRRALLNNSNSLIIAHNHPSGDLKPSEEDEDIFDRLKKIGEIIQINVLDSIVFNKEQYYSLNEVSK